MASSAPPFLLLLFVLVAAAAAASDSEERPRVTPTLVQCHPPQAQATANASSAKNATAFRANVVSLLRALPSAAAPTGFASLRSAGVVGRDAAFARGLCFGYATPSQCRECLSAAAKKLTDACGARGRHAGVWTDACFASYADANASSPSYDGFRARIISGADALITSTSYELQSLADLAWRMGPVAAINAGMQVAVDWTTSSSDYSKNSTVRAGPHAGGVRVVRPVLGAGGGDLRVVLVPPAVGAGGGHLLLGPRCVARRRGGRRRRLRLLPALRRRRRHRHRHFQCAGAGAPAQKAR
ncbi:hypothetical protein ACQJBY_008513 [Aegilops geniculata]